MRIGFSRLLAVVVVSTSMAGCIDRANTPILVPVGTPVNPPLVAHSLCIAEGNSMFDEAKSQYKLRAQMTGYVSQDPLQADATAQAAARRQYTACLSSEGYRAYYSQ
ncbi:hypothetical protein [Oryzifoliimicrobium ureilyticus]|uniref:hypothetical protein n=1 Tax=Oryzifoliimicrobium ureilyticus TaxID=3113724 RepID=UPI00307677F6